MLRDSTQIVVPADRLGEELRTELDRRFTVTMFEEYVDSVRATRVIGSPVEIKRVNEYLARQGLTLP